MRLWFSLRWFDWIELLFALYAAVVKCRDVGSLSLVVSIDILMCGTLLLVATVSVVDARMLFLVLLPMIDEYRLALRLKEVSAIL